MNKILIAIVVAILIGGGGIYYYTSVRNHTKVSPSTSETTDNEGLQADVTLQGLLGLGKNLQCTFSSSGLKDAKVYVSGKHIRGDFTVSGGTATDVSASMISDGEWMYYWSSAMPQGMKMKMDFTATAKTQTQAFDPSAKLNYNCKSWIPDSSKFDLPSGVVFTELNVPASGSGSAPTASCSTCDYLTGADRDSCRQALGC